jgi:thiamine-monophosphate kinase
LGALAHAALDVSDGLIADLDHMCRVSGGRIELEAAAVPLSPAGRAHVQKGGALTDLVTGGDDLQIAFAAPPSAAEALVDTAKETATALTRIGHFIADSTAQRAILCDESGAEISLLRRGYTHF